MTTGLTQLENYNFFRNGIRRIAEYPSYSHGTQRSLLSGAA